MSDVERENSGLFVWVASFYAFSFGVQRDENDTTCK